MYKGKAARAGGEFFRDTKVRNHIERTTLWRAVLWGSEIDTIPFQK